MSERKKLTLKIAAWLLVFLLVCTVVSQTVYRMLLPVVETVDVREGSLSAWVEETGRLTWSDQLKLPAGEEWEVTEVLVKKGDSVTKGTPLFRIDVRKAEIAFSKAELEILKLTNQLAENSLSAAEQSELSLQIQIAEQELEAWRSGLPFASDIQELELKLAVLKLENQEEVDQAKLQLARDELERYRQSGAGYDKTEEKRLRSLIASCRQRLKNQALSQEQRDAIQLELDTAEQDLDALLASSDGYDPLEEERLRQAVLAAEQALKETPSERDRSELELQKEIAQEQLALYQQKKSTTTEVEGKKLQLALLQLKNQLAGKAKSAGEKQELSKQIEIAREELALQRETWPSDGIVRAPADGTVSSLSAKKGEVLFKGKPGAVLSTQSSRPCVTWELSAEAGAKYGQLPTAMVTLPKEGGLSGTSLEAVITDRELDESTKRWKFTAALELPEGTLPPEETANLRVRMTIKSDNYDCVVPLSCLRENSSGQNTVLLLKYRQGVFSEEGYLTEAVVEVLEKNSLNAAVKSSELDFASRIVHYSSKPVFAGSVVSAGTVE